MSYFRVQNSFPNESYTKNETNFAQYFMNFVTDANVFIISFTSLRKNVEFKCGNDVEIRFLLTKRRVEEGKMGKMTDKSSFSIRRKNCSLEILQSPLLIRM